jgi:hypothetical protein
MLREQRLRIALGCVLVVYVAALSQRWYQDELSSGDFGTFFRDKTIGEPGWTLVPLSTALFFVPLLAWRDWGRHGRLLVRESLFLLVLCTLAGVTRLGTGVLHTRPVVTGTGPTIWMWVALASVVTAAVLGALLARGHVYRMPPGKAPLRLRGQRRFVVPILVAPVVLLLPWAFGWDALWTGGLGVGFTVAVLLAIWALVVIRGTVKPVVGVRVARELGRLVLLFPVLGAALSLSTLAIGQHWVSPGVGSVVHAAGALLAWVASTAWVHGSYRALFGPEHLPPLLRIDRIPG